MRDRRQRACRTTAASRTALRQFFIGAAVAAGALIPNQRATAEPVFVPGKTVGITPPPGFVLSEDFAGFRNATSGATILVVEYPASFYAHVKAGMENGTAVPKGLEVADAKSVRIGATDGLMLHGRKSIQGSPADVWMLLLAGKAATVVLAVTEPQDGPLDDEKVSRLFSNVRLRARPSLDMQLSRLPFAFGEMAGFKVWRTVLGRMALLSQAPGTPPNPKTNPILIVSSRQYGLADDTDSRRLAAIALRTEPGIAFDPVKSTRTATVAGGTGHVAIASGTDRRTKSGVRAKVWFRFRKGRLLTAISLIDATIDDRILGAMQRVVAGIRAL